MQRTRKIYIEETPGFAGLRPLMFLGFIIVCIVLLSCLLSNAHDRARQDLIEALSMERQIKDSHQKLTSELAGITQSRFLALKAQERLGLSKPKDEEVLVLK